MNNDSIRKQVSELSKAIKGSNKNVKHKIEKGKIDNIKQGQ